MLQSNNPPSIKIEMEFNFTGNSKRPDSIDVDVYVNNLLDDTLSDTYQNPL